MKISKSLEQAVFVLLILALQAEHKPVKSYVLSAKLDVSDSYLKKILRKLVVHELIISTASKEGGFQLKRSIEEITLYDVYEAVEEDTIEQFHSRLARNLFSDEAYVASSEKKIKQAMINAKFALKELALSDLIRRDKYNEGAVEWAEVNSPV
ncbi:Rrf2 family transcriptional regulator [uncultured Veillonella sp.]|uniref:RrF2 family transcriptional regulator n=1 Tax=uncultured Veillonella sp. TaxID=159268 RepID=UPI0025DA1AF5|nr:Rrf2 family transcriptional regulator [uncultured Veillonella sp.]